ncbi:MAG TPA: L-seryl-tRNA(Sec) selenium transferase [Dehalococcoidia bacterium]|nr:L-seryl-tRNA(Sec) selenium transferase [Dehalococcoidia bacterium]
MNAYRELPSVDRLLASGELRSATSELGIEAVTQAAREELTALREGIGRGESAPEFEEVVTSVATRAYKSLRSGLKPVINATGVIIHTNLGRAPLSDEAIEAMAAVSRGYSNLEFDLAAGERGSRHEHVESLLKRVTGAEAAMAVNNNASALLLVLSAVAHEREVVISRGQLVEIGGGFRIPDVMLQSGARLTEVGTTNRTYLRDYEAAVTPETAALMRVHASNFRISGFTTSASLEELAGLAHARGLLLLDDLGSGCLLDTRPFGLPQEPTPQGSLQAGADLVLFSGDKLLGGPQAGIIVGKADLIAKLKRHPLARALRLDKATIAGLNATLLHYARGEALTKVPIWRMISAPLAELDARAQSWSEAVGAGASVVDARSMIGGGSLPEESLPSRVLAIAPTTELPAQELAARLRHGALAVVGRVEHARLLLDPRTVQPDEDASLVSALKQALA